MSIVNQFKKILKQDDQKDKDKDKNISSESKKITSVKKQGIVKSGKAKSPKETAVTKKESVKKENLNRNIDIYRILKSPVITEKTTDLGMLNKYVFRINSETTKNEVKKAVETLYNVGVLNVNIVNVPRKKRRRGRVMGWKSGFKKAIITVKEGEKLEIVSQ